MRNYSNTYTLHVHVHVIHFIFSPYTYSTSCCYIGLKGSHNVALHNSLDTCVQCATPTHGPARCTHTCSYTKHKHVQHLMDSSDHESLEIPPPPSSTFPPLPLPSPRPFPPPVHTCTTGAPSVPLGADTRGHIALPHAGGPIQAAALAHHNGAVPSSVPWCTGAVEAHAPSPTWLDGTELEPVTVHVREGGGGGGTAAGEVAPPQGRAHAALRTWAGLTRVWGGERWYHFRQ